MTLSLARMILCLLVFAVPSVARASEVIRPDGLEQRVDFWKKIFTEYGKDDLVIHDRFHVNLIYDVATDSNVKTKISTVENALREIRANLDNPEKMDLFARQIHRDMIAQGIPATAATLANLITSIHTQRGIKERFRDGIVRSGRYVEKFREIFEEEGVPRELALLPLVESSFQNVRSKAGAMGIWQFTTGTGRLYMKVSGPDQRLDPIIATRSAARLLRDNHKALGVWPLAITAYNHGRGGMLRAQKAHGSDITKVIDEYRGPVFGYASMNFYAEFLAAVQVYEDYPVYFGQLALDKPDTPALRPKNAAPANAVASASLGEKYRVRRGDTLSAISRRYGTSIRELMQRNNLTKSTIYAGQILLIN